MSGYEHIVRTIIKHMPDIVVRSPVEKTTTETSVNPVHYDKKVGQESSIEPPFTDYAKVHNQPFSVDYFDLGSMWNEDGVYAGEVGVIENYLKQQVDEGKANTLESAKQTMKQLEKIIGVRDTDRTVVRVGRLAAYIKFLQESDDILHQVRKYAH